jgi:two-component system cell cycle sensor histidine kinase/response regulator CckA
MAEPRMKAVLLVEDEAELRELFSLLLESEQLKVLQAGNGPDALKVLEENAGAIDLIVTDMNLPGLDGTKIVARARAMAPSAKILAMSGYGGPEMQSVASKAGADGFLSKPFHPTQAVLAVKQMLDLP